MKMIRRILPVLLLLSTQTAAPMAQDKVTVGRLEKVRIYPGNLTIRAKVDTGAKTCSLGCESISSFERNGEKWVRFTVTNHLKKSVTLERKVERIATIKRHFWRKQERMVVTLGICLRGVFKEAEVNLVDRSGFNYRMLIGRTFLIDDFIIDPSLKYTAEPLCKGIPGLE